MISAHPLPWPSTAKLRNWGKYQGVGIDTHYPSIRGAYSAAVRCGTHFTQECSTDRALGAPAKREQIVTGRRRAAPHAFPYPQAPLSLGEGFHQRGTDGAALPPWAFLQGLPCRGVSNPALKLAAVILTIYFDN